MTLEESGQFFQFLFEEMTRLEYGMFTYPEEASYMWFPVKPKFEKLFLLWGSVWIHLQCCLHPFPTVSV